ncbi:uncharacterized protein LOC131955137 [Physella acuta]|uniref:uncharacterized protein LOC131955137 n=1 Tax=Physella acuta TaxID=109671 RepID=UPI0027DB453E|nr:uncharacterized protein LOC131955137 [Physella acuta]XP_059175105.1 uncharacterized protein LOC131955137 [Physella acuta]XP_059175106.1 uncharacterized protein LOC131955137 [Physella acuta]
MNRAELCVQLVKGLENVWNENILFDFAVKVQDKIIECHRLILAACSEFFRALFRSGMKEVTENCVVLKDVSCEVFSLILNFLYTGTSLLTLDNFIDVWRAAHMLQIDLMIHVCEQFAIESLSTHTWENIYENANLFGSANILVELHSFLLKNFEQCRYSETFLQLSFEEVKDLIKSQDLVVSKEDSVLEFLIKWINYKPTSNINIHESSTKNNERTIRNNDLKPKIAFPSVDENKLENRANNTKHGPSNIKEASKTSRIKMTEDSEDILLEPILKSCSKNNFTELLKLVRTYLVSKFGVFRVMKKKLLSEVEIKIEEEDSSDIFFDSFDYINLDSCLSEEEIEFKERCDNLKHDSIKVADACNSVRSNTSFPNTDQLQDSVNIVNSSREDRLIELLKLVRTCLVSPVVLSRVLKMELFTENNDAREILIDSLLYYFLDWRHGHWPSTAIHRSCSEYTHAGVCAVSGGLFEFKCARTEKVLAINVCIYLRKFIQLVTFENELFAIGKFCVQPNEPCRMFVFREKSWKEVMELPSHNLLLVSHGDFIYVLNKDDGFIYMMNPKSGNPSLEALTALPEYVNATHSMVIEDILLLFCSKITKGIDETVVYAMDFSSKMWTRLNTLDGPAEQLISFRNDQHNYVLQRNGILWLIVNTSSSWNVQFKFLAKLWQFEKNLCGAFTYESKLIIMKNRVYKKCKKHIPDHFETISYWGKYGISSNFVPITVLKSPELLEN